MSGLERIVTSEELEYAARQVTIESRRHRIVELQGELGELSLALNEFERQYRARIGNLQTEIDRMRKEITDYRDRITHLKARIALPLEPPPDWIRTGSIACQCAHCRALSRFLAAPDQPVWQFKANEVDRQHVAHSIQRAQCDLDLATNKRGRPYTCLLYTSPSPRD